MALGDYVKTTYIEGTAPGISATRLNNNEAKTEELDTAVSTHLAEKASDTVLGHIKQGIGITIDESGVASVASGSAGFKKGSSTYTDRDTAQTFTDSFCTVNSLVVIAITSATAPQGKWTVDSADGSFTITSDKAETADITFDYYIQKAVV